MAPKVVQESLDFVVSRSVGWVNGQQTLQYFNEIARVGFRQALDEVAQVDLKEKSLVKVIAIHIFLKQGRLKQRHSHAEHAFLDQAKLSVHPREIPDLFGSIEVLLVEVVAIVLIDHVVVDDLQQSLRSDEDLLAVKTDHRFELGQRHIARLEDAP